MKQRTSYFPDDNERVIRALEQRKQQLQRAPVFVEALVIKEGLQAKKKKAIGFTRHHVGAEAAISLPKLSGGGFAGVNNFSWNIIFDLVADHDGNDLLGQGPFTVNHAALIWDTRTVDAANDVDVITLGSIVSTRTTQITSSGPIDVGSSTLYLYLIKPNGPSPYWEVGGFPYYADTVMRSTGSLVDITLVTNVNYSTGSSYAVGGGTGSGPDVYNQSIHDEVIYPIPFDSALFSGKKHITTTKVLINVSYSSLSYHFNLTYPNSDNAYWGPSGVSPITLDGNISGNAYAESGTIDMLTADIALP